MSTECAKSHLHTKQPDGYMAWHHWAEMKSKRHYQIKCPECGRYEIWKRKQALEDGDG